MGQASTAGAGGAVTGSASYVGTQGWHGVGEALGYGRLTGGQRSSGSVLTSTGDCARAVCVCGGGPSSTGWPVSKGHARSRVPSGEGETYRVIGKNKQVP